MWVNLLFLLLVDDMKCWEDEEVEKKGFKYYVWLVGVDLEYINLVYDWIIEVGILGKELF